MPAAIIIGIAGATGLTAAVGGAIVSSIVGATVAATTAGTIASAVVGSALVAGTATALTGGTVKDVLKSAVLGGVTAGIAAPVSQAISADVFSSLTTSGAVGTTAATIIGNTLGGAAAGAITSGTAALLSGQDPVAALIRGGLTAGLSSAVTSSVDELTRDIPFFNKSPNTLEGAFGRATKAAIATGILGGSASDTFTRSVITSLGTMGFNYIKDQLTDKSGDLSTASSDFNSARNDYNSTVQAAHSAATNYNSEVEKLSGYYTHYKGVLDGYQGQVDRYNSLVTNPKAFIESQGWYYWQNPKRGTEWYAKPGWTGMLSLQVLVDYEADMIDWHKDYHDRTATWYQNIENGAKPVLDYYQNQLDVANAKIPDLAAKVEEKFKTLEDTISSFRDQEAANTAVALKAMEDIAIAKQIFKEQEGRDPTDAELAQFATSGDLVGNIDRAKTTRDEAIELWRSKFGTEPSEFDLLGIEGLSETDALSEVSDIFADRETTDSEELDSFIGDIVGDRISYSQEDKLELLGLPENEVRNRLIEANNAFVRDFNETTPEEAQARWEAAGNTRDMTPEELIKMTSGNQGYAELVARRIADLEEVIFNGDSFGTQEEALAAAKEAGGYQEYSYKGRIYSTDQPTVYKSNASSQTAAIQEAVRNNRNRVEWRGTVINVDTDIAEVQRQINSQSNLTDAIRKAAELLGEGVQFQYKDQGIFVTPRDSFDASNYTNRGDAAIAAHRLGYTTLTFSDGKTYKLPDNFQYLLYPDQTAAESRRLAEQNLQLFTGLVKPFDGSGFGSLEEAAVAANTAGKQYFTYGGQLRKLPDNFAQLIAPNQSAAETRRLVEQNAILVNDAQIRAQTAFNALVSFGDQLPADSGARQIIAAGITGVGNAAKSIIGFVNGVTSIKIGQEPTLGLSSPQVEEARRYGVVISPYDSPEQRAAKLRNLEELKAVGAQPLTTTQVPLIDRNSSIYKAAEFLIDTGVLNSPDVQAQKAVIQNAVKDEPWYLQPIAAAAYAANGNSLGFWGWVLEELPTDALSLAASNVVGRGLSIAGRASIATAIDTATTYGLSFENGRDEALRSGKTYEQAVLDGQMLGAISAFSEVLPEHFTNLAMQSAISRELKSTVLQNMLSYGASASKAISVGAVSDYISGYTDQALSSKYKTGQFDFAGAATAGALEMLISPGVSGSLLAGAEATRVIGRMYDGTAATVRDLVERNTNIDYGTISRTDPIFNVGGNQLNLNQITNIADTAINTPTLNTDTYITNLKNLGEAGFVDSSAADVALKLTLAPDLETLNTQLQTFGLDAAEAATVADLKFDSQVTTEKEAKNLFQSAGYTPTDAEIKDFAGIKTETNQLQAINAYVDQNRLDVDEVKTAALAEGITLTTAQAQQYVRQANEQQAINELRAQLDPTSTTREEAIQFLKDAGFTDSQAGVAATQFTGRRAESDILSEIATYTDPRQVTFDEAKKFLQDLGYTPTDDEVRQFVAQDLAQIQDRTIRNIESYVDPRLVTEQEVKDAYAVLGLSRPSQSDIQALVGQYSESDLAGRASENLDVARYNSILEQLDNLSVGANRETLDAISAVKADINNQLENLGFDIDKISNDISSTKTDIIEAIEAAKLSGIEGTEALNLAINNVASNLGITKTELLARIGESETTILGEFRDYIGEISEQITDTEQAILDKMAEYEATGASRDEALSLAIDAVAADLGKTKTELLDQIGKSEQTLRDEFQSGIEDVTTEIGDIESAILAKMADYEAAGIDRDVALGLAIGAVAEDLNTTKADLLSQIGETEASLREEILASEAALGEQISSGITQLQTDLAAAEKAILDKMAEYEAAGMDRDEALQLAIGDVATQLNTTAENLSKQIIDAETALGTQITESTTALQNQINATAEILGKPAQQVTQEDINYVNQLINGEITTEPDLSYDVNQDGKIDQSDLNILTSIVADGGEPPQPWAAGTKWAPSGVFKEISGLRTDIIGQLEEMERQRIADAEAAEKAAQQRAKEQQRRANVQQMQTMLMQPGALTQKVDVKTPDPVKLDQLYDWSSIFRTPQQEQLFVSPFGSYADGGEVTEEELLRIIGG